MCDLKRSLLEFRNEKNYLTYYFMHIVFVRIIGDKI